MNFWKKAPAPVPSIPTFDFFKPAAPLPPPPVPQQDFWKAAPEPEPQAPAADFWKQESAEEPAELANDFWLAGTPAPELPRIITKYREIAWDDRDYVDRLDPSQTITSFDGSVAWNGERSDADPDISGYHWLVGLTPHGAYTIEAHRLEHDLDTAMYVFANLHTFEDFLASGTLTNEQYFSDGTIDFLAWADDQIPYAGGPYGDPRAQITAPESGELTVVVTNFASGSNHGGDFRFDYRLDVINHDPLGEAPVFSETPFWWDSVPAGAGDVEIVGSGGSWWDQPLLG